MVKNLFKGCLTVPNLLSLIRIFLIPAFAVLYYKGHIGWAVLMLALSGISDFLDGKIARRFNQVSELGKILDPVADKLTQITIAVMLYIAFRSCNDQLMVAFSWVFLVFLAKEAVMVIGGAIMIACGIKAIWNFTDMEIDTGDSGVVVEDIHFSDSLLVLGYNLSTLNEK